MICAITGLPTIKNFKGMSIHAGLLAEARIWSDLRGLTLREGIAAVAEKWKKEFEETGTIDSIFFTDKKYSRRAE